MNVFSDILIVFINLIYRINNSPLLMIYMLTPFVIFIELPVMIFVIVGILKWKFKINQMKQLNYFPKVSCCITCYNEGYDVIKTLKSLTYQRYPGFIEIIAVVDGANENKITLEAIESFQKIIEPIPNRSLIIIAKWQRGGRVSSINAALKASTGIIFMALDGDTSFRNDFVLKAAKYFIDKNIIAIAGNLRVRNETNSIITRLQALEYMLSISAGRTGFASFNVINNISGAFGIFRKSILELVQGWDTGTAEDLDMTIRLKQYFKRNPNWKIVFDPTIIGFTDVPDTLVGFLKQRIRWEGDLYYILIRKYIHNIRPSLLGWTNFIFSILSIYVLQVIMPFIILFYSIYMLFVLPLASFLALLLFVYLVYLVILFCNYVLYYLFVSDYRKNDRVYFLYLPVYPFFAFLDRINAALAIAYSMLNRSHLESSMAPYWVLRKGKF